MEPRCTFFFSAYIFFITSYSIKGSLLFHFLRLASRFYSLPRWVLPITFSAFALQITENRNLNWSTLVISTEIFWRQMFYDATVFPNLFSIKIPSNARCFPPSVLISCLFWGKRYLNVFRTCRTEHYLQFHSDEGFIYGIFRIENKTNVKSYWYAISFDEKQCNKETFRAVVSFSMCDKFFANNWKRSAFCKVILSKNLWIFVLKYDRY